MPANAADHVQPLVLFEDEPTFAHGEDKLKLIEFARIVAGTALGTRGPFTIGVFGTWGTGKTSLLRQSKSLIDAQNATDVVTVWFNAWQYEHEDHPIVPLVASMVDQIDRKLAEAPHTSREQAVAVAGSALGRLGRALRALAYGFSAKTKVAVPGFAEVEAGFVAKEMIERYDKLSAPKDPLLQRTLYYNAFELLRDAVPAKGAGEQPPKVVVFVDDLDRCMPAKAVRLLESIKLVLTQPGFIYALALDQKVVERFIEVEYRKAFDGAEQLVQGVNYLDKLIQLPLRLPDHSKRFEEYIERLVSDERHQKVPENQQLAVAVLQLKSAIAVGVNHNPRSLVRLLNNLLVDRRLFAAFSDQAEDGQELVGLLVVHRLLQYALSAEFDLLNGSPEICRKLANGATPEDMLREHGEKYGKEHPDDRSMRERGTEALFRKLRDAQHLTTLLGTEVGKKWLAADQHRKEITHFFKEAREDVAAPIDQVELIDTAIRQEMGLPDSTPISEDHRKLVKELDLAGTLLTDAGAAYLANFNNLTVLGLDGTPLTDAGAAHLTKLDNLTKLDLDGTSLTDAGAAHLANLANLKTLWLDRTQLTDAGVAHLSNLTNLTNLSLNGTPLTDAGAAYLANLTNLRALWLNDTKLADAGVAHLTRLANLRTLRLNDTQLTDAAAAHLAKIASLTKLDLDSTLLTNAGAAHLAKLANLTALWLNDTKLTDAGAAHLAKLANLTTLSLIGTKLTDAGAAHLAKLANLTSLSLIGTKLTDAGKSMLRKAIPKCRIDF